LRDEKPVERIAMMIRQVLDRSDMICPTKALAFKA
jgi:hypothetical protein